MWRCYNGPKAFLNERVQTIYAPANRLRRNKCDYDCKYSKSKTNYLAIFPPRFTIQPMRFVLCQFRRPPKSGITGRFLTVSVFDLVHRLLSIWLKLVGRKNCIIYDLHYYHTSTLYFTNRKWWICFLLTRA